MAKTIAEMTAEIREVNVAKGWRPAEGGPGENTWGDYIALLHSEISEALEAYRDHRLADATHPACGRAANTGEPCPEHGPSKPEGVGSELADVLIRLLDMCDVFGIGASGYERLADIRSASTFMPVRSFGDHMSWLHSEVSVAWGRRGHIAAVLRALLSVARKYEIDLDAEYERKIAYNRTRSFRHGGRTLAGDKPAAEAPLTPGAAARLNSLWLEIPTDPRDWWTGDEIEVFISQWERLRMPKLTLCDATGERLTLWCSDMRRAAEMLGMTDSIVDAAEGFEITKDAYSVGIVQAEVKEKETSGGEA